MVKGWQEEAEELAVYEGYLCRRAELMKAAVYGKWKGERDAAEAAFVQRKAAEKAALAAAAASAAAAAAAATGSVAAKKAAQTKAASASYALQRASASTFDASNFVPSPALARAKDAARPFIAAYTRWISDTSIPSHQVWQEKRMAAPAAAARGLDALIAKALGGSDLRSGIVAAAAGVEGSAARIDEELGRAWSLGAATGGPLVAAGGGAGGGAAAGAAGMLMAMGGYYGGGVSVSSDVGVNLDSFKTLHSCTSYAIAACMADAVAELNKALDALTRDSLEVEDD